jgi:hypothetical protein
VSSPRFEPIIYRIKVKIVTAYTKKLDSRFITSAVAAFMTVRLWTANLTTEESGFDYSNSGSRDFSFAITPRLTLGLTQPPTHWVPGTLSPGVNRLRRQADHSLLVSAEVASACSLLIYSYVFIAQYVIQQRAIFFYILYFKILSTLQPTVRHTWAGNLEEGKSSVCRNFLLAYEYRKYVENRI